MWKYLSRGVRETLERRINFSRKDRATGQECPIGAIHNKLIPGIVSTHTFDNGSADLGGRCKNGPCNDKKQHNGDQQGEKWRQNWCIEQPALLGALGWTGVMVLGWYICQPICRRRRAQSPELERLRRQAGLSLCHTEYVSLFRILSRVALAQPLSILPQRVVEQFPPSPSSSSSVPHPLQLKSSSTISVDLSDGSEDSVPELKYGPITAEEALDEAADNLTKAQNTAISGIENRLGVACVQLGKYKEALPYFRRAAELDYAPAAFNLGLCYETGVGTAQDLKLAAKFYKLASSWGHATAMYNLGVFYVHGWGGVPVDCDRARQLFVAAAKLGQTNAQEALLMVTPASEEDSTVHIIETEASKPEAVLSYESSRMKILYQVLGIMKSRQSVAVGPASLRNIPPVKSEETRPLYQTLGTNEPGTVRNDVGNTLSEDESNEDFNLHDELVSLNIENVATECKAVPHFSVGC